MDCTHVRTSISASLDGEEAGIPDALVDAHLRGCPGCAAFAAEANALHGRIRLAGAPEVRDVTPGVLAAIGALEETRRPSMPAWFLRVVLAVVGAVLVATALPALVLGEDQGASVHAAHHFGSFAAALAVGFLFAAWKPERIPGVLPIVAVLVVCMVGTSIADLIGRRTVVQDELGHLVEVVGLVALWLARSDAHPRARLRPSVTGSGWSRSW